MFHAALVVKDIAYLCYSPCLVASYLLSAVCASRFWTVEENILEVHWNLIICLLHAVTSHVTTLEREKSREKSL